MTGIGVVPAGFYGVTEDITDQQILTVTALVYDRIPAADVEETLLMLGLTSRYEAPPSNESWAVRVTVINSHVVRSHCPSGHELTPDNTWSAGKRDHHRRCKTCTQARNRAYRMRIRDAKRAEKGTS